jgi:hypothetical protein
MCLDDFILPFELSTLTITILSLQFISIAGKDFSIIGKSIKSSRSQSASTVAISSDVSSDSIVDLIKIVCLPDLYETIAPPRVKIYPLVAYNSSTSDIQYASLYPSNTIGYPE